MRQLTFSIDDDRSFFLSKLPVRQLTFTFMMLPLEIISKLPMRQLTRFCTPSHSASLSKLPMRQLTGAVCAIILILLDLHQFSLIEPKI